MVGSRGRALRCRPGRCMGSHSLWWMACSSSTLTKCRPGVMPIPASEVLGENALGRNENFDLGGLSFERGRSTFHARGAAGADRGVFRVHRQTSCQDIWCIHDWSLNDGGTWGRAFHGLPSARDGEYVLSVGVFVYSESIRFGFNPAFDYRRNLEYFSGVPIHIHDRRDAPHRNSRRDLHWDGVSAVEGDQHPMGPFEILRDRSLNRKCRRSPSSRLAWPSCR